MSFTQNCMWLKQSTFNKMKSLSPLAFPIYKLCIYFKLSPSGTCVSFLWMVTGFFIRKNKFDLLVKTNTYILIVNIKICNRRWKNIRPDQDLNKGLPNVWSNELPNIIGLNWSVIISPTHPFTKVDMPTPGTDRFSFDKA